MAQCVAGLVDQTKDFARRIKADQARAPFERRGDNGARSLVAARAREDQDVAGAGVAVVAKQGSLAGKVGIQIGAVGLADHDAARIEPAPGLFDRKPVAFPMERRGGAAHGLGKARHGTGLAQRGDAERDRNHGADDGELVALAKHAEQRQMRIVSSQAGEFVIASRQSRGGDRGSRRIQGEGVEPLAE